MEKELTTIMIYKEDKKLLDELANFRKENYRDIFHRLIKFEEENTEDNDKENELHK